MAELTTMEAIAGFLTPAIVFVLMLALHVVFPALRVDGYSHPNTAPAQYRLNGGLVLLVALLIWWSEFGTPMDWLWRVKWHAIAGATALSVVVSLWLVYREPADARNALVQWLEGRARNSEFMRGIDVKMFLYIFGGGYLALFAVSSAAYHEGLFGPSANLGLYLHSAMWVWFVVDYFCFERVQLYTFDIIEERVGFKLIVGCIVVYPCLYPVALLFLADMPAPAIDPAYNTLWLGGSAVVFLAGWVITRGANFQKYTFKRAPEKAFLGFMQPTTITDGSKTILCGGFWGVTRHMNYFGEILLALGMALALGHYTNFWNWIYFVYLVVFFIVRERIDDRRCATKYGALWDEYRANTKRRLIPGLY